MYLSKDLLGKSFQMLGGIGSKEGEARLEQSKAGLERVSAISRFLACAEILKANNVTSVDLAPGSVTRTEFVEKVGKVLGLGPNNEFTPDFANLDNKNDYNVGSNFLTTQVYATRSSKKDYPSRPAPLLTLDHEKASIHADFKKSLDDSYDWQRFKAAFSIWLSKDYVFTQNADPETVANELNAFHQDRFGTSVAAYVELVPREFQAFIQGVDEPFADVKPDLVELAKKPAVAGSSASGCVIPANRSPVFLVVRMSSSMVRPEPVSPIELTQRSRQRGKNRSELSFIQTSRTAIFLDASSRRWTARKFATGSLRGHL